MSSSLCWAENDLAGARFDFHHRIGVLGMVRRGQQPLQMNEARNDSRPRVAYHRGCQQPLEAKLTRDWNAEWQQINNEQKEASDAYTGPWRL